MRVQALGCSGAIAQGAYTSAFLIDAALLLDAGTGLGQLSLERMLEVQHIFLTHAHLDHIAALPLMLDAVMASRTRAARPPINVYAHAETIAALRKHVFNRVIWPDFTVLPTREQPVMQFVPIQAGQKIQFEDLPYHIEVLPAVHTVAALGFAVQAGAQAPAVVYTGDTGSNAQLWRRVNALPMGALIIESAFSNGQSLLARAALHLTPDSLRQELAQLDPSKHFPIYITHTKPADAQAVREEVQAWAAAGDEAAGGDEPSYDIRFLQCGQIFEV